MDDSSRTDPASSRWEELSRCPECQEPMKQENAAGERLGLYYRCTIHGRFRYSWDHDRLEAVGDLE